MTIDLGTGDGRAVLAAAVAEPATLVLGIDASAAAMAEASRRAARPARKGGLPNAAFALAAAEWIPPGLVGIADRVTVQFPWGSLLRGCLGANRRAATGIASLVAPGGVLELLVAPAERDRLEDVPVHPEPLAAAARATFEALGLQTALARPATAAEIAASHSSWARRLGAGRDGERIVMLVRLERAAVAQPVAGGAA